VGKHRRVGTKPTAFIPDCPKHMTQWTYLVVAKNEPRYEGRVFQIVDKQQTPLLAFSGHRLGEEFFMTLVVEADESKARRIEALLHKLQPTLHVKVHSDP
jgi:hypothetical protein